MPSEHREVGPFAVLLAALVFFMFGMAFFTADAGVGPWILRLGTLLVLLAAVYVANEQRWQLAVGLGLALPTLGSLLYEAVFIEQEMFLLRAAFNAALLFYTALLILISLVKQQRVSVDTILGGINVYLLFIIGFMFLHGLAEASSPGSYLYQGEALAGVVGEIHGIQAAGTLLYYSVATMTTLGFGDIVPVAPVAQALTSAEAIAGQLYVAIFIARLVALQVGQASGARKR